MKFHISILLLLILASCGTSQKVNSKTIFRYIDLGLYGQLEIGDEIDKFKPIITAKDGRFYLQKNAFSGANSIELIIDTANRVSEMIFDYGNKVSLELKISEYEYLGKPKFENDSALWNDGKTQFSIYKRNASVYSKITRLR
jgi:hypothetical protein